MTDPVDTNALRTNLLAAGPVIQNAIGWAEHEGAGPDSDEQEAIDATLSGASAAADEVDRLRAERDSWQRRAGDLYDEWDQQVHVAIGLRAVIENAPHNRTACRFVSDAHTDRYPCTCWKADAL